MAYSFNNPYSLTIHNDKDGIGIRLLAKKKNGVFTLLQGIRIYGNNSFESDDSYKLQYTNSGRIKRTLSPGMQDLVNSQSGYNTARTKAFVSNVFLDDCPNAQQAGAVPVCSQQQWVRAGGQFGLVY